MTPWFMLAFGISAATAATHPPFLPNHDVTVGYIVSAPGRADASYQLEYEAAGQRARIDNPAQGTYFLVDLPDGTAQLVVPALHSIVNAPDISGLTQQINSAGNARFTPLGHGTYAGLPCENYLVLNQQGSGTVCLTPDGVILHFAGKDEHGAATVSATSVASGPLLPDDFIPPAGFGAITLPPGALTQLLGQ